MYSNYCFLSLALECEFLQAKTALSLCLGQYSGSHKKKLSNEVGFNTYI